MMTVDKSWTLFLDRDGVINHRIIGGYITKLEEFKFLDGVLEALELFNQMFGKIVIVTNQQGIGKSIMTESDLQKLHKQMIEEIDENKGRIDSVYHCPELAENKSPCRKPNVGMALQAQLDFPEIDFQKSIMVGDSLSDIKFGKKLKMKTVYISDEKTKPHNANYMYLSLLTLAEDLYQYSFKATT